MIDVSVRHGAALLTLQRSDKRNALNIAMCNQLRDEVVGVIRDGARAILITGAGSSFCSGADLDAVYDTAFRDSLYAMLNTIADAPVPVVAAVNGPAIGAGTQLAIAADLRVVAPSARFAVPTARLGLAVDPWTIARLVAIVGTGAARRLLLACDELDAHAAAACGLADREGTSDDAFEWVSSMAALAPLTIRYSKRVLNDVALSSRDPRIAGELVDAFERCWTSADFAEGRLARLEKRAPRFEGR